MSKIETLNVTRKSWGSHIEIIGGPVGPWKFVVYEYKYPVDDNGAWVDPEQPLDDGESRHVAHTETITVADMADSRTLADGRTITRADVMAFLACEVDDLFNKE